MSRLICFIDDSEFEHDLVRREIAPQTPDLEFCQAYTFEEAQTALGATKPALFLLDLWGQDKSVVNPHVTPKADLQRDAAQFPTLDTVYEGLDHFKGDLHNEYLKRLFSIVHHWRALFEKACDNIGQNRKYGLANMEQVRRHYPGVPAVFYTRKSLITDAVALFRARADGLFIKPTGTDEPQTRAMTRAYAPTLQEELKRIMESFPSA
ncbi:MAG: response regulator [Deltaproteobacteria bacterium]|nr:response regulator [Deltaproteobacteria bacterium]